MSLMWHQQLKPKAVCLDAFDAYIAKHT